MTIGVAHVEIRPSFRNIHKETKKGLQGVEGEFDATGKRSGNRFTQAVGGIAKAGLVAAGGLAAGAFGAAIAKGFGRLTAIDDAQARLRGLGYDAKAIDSLMASALESVKGTAYGLGDAAGVAAILSAAGVKSGQEMTNSLKLVADAAFVSGSSLSDMGALFGKVAAKGKLDGEVMAQLLERQVGILPALAEHYGVTREEAAKMVSEGKVSFKDFATVMEDMMGGAALRSGETFKGAWDNVGAALGRIGLTLLKPFFDLSVKGMGSLVTALDAADKALQPFMEKVGDALPGILQNVGNAVGRVVNFFRDWWPVLAVVTAGVLGYVAAMKAMLIIEVVRKALAAAAAAQWGLNAAMAANPVGLVVAAIGALIAGVVIAYTKFDWFRKVVDATWSGIKTAVGAVASWFMTYVWPTINIALNAVATAFTWLWQNVISPAFNGIVAVIRWAINNVVIPLFNAYVAYLQTIVFPIFRFLYENVVKPVFAAIVTVISWAWAGIKVIWAAISWYIKNILSPIFSVFLGVVKFVWNAIVAVIRWAWNNVIKPVWAAIQWYINNILAPVFRLLLAVIQYVWQRINAAISQAWTWIRANVFQPINNWIHNTLGPAFTFLKDRVVNTWNQIRANIDRVWAWIRRNVFSPLEHAVKSALPDAFEKGKNAIGKAWDKLRALARKPVAFAVETIMRDGLVKPFNKVADFFKADKIDEKFFTVPKLYTGGPVPGWSPSPTADNIPIMATAGEYMVRHAATRRMNRKYPGLLDHINQHGDIPGYAGGGQVKKGTLWDAAQWWVGKGARASRHSWFNPGGRRTTSGHSRNSYHYKDLAVDFNYGPGGQNATEMGFFDRHIGEFQRLFSGIRTIWRAPGHYNHLHIDTAKGANMGTGSKSGGGGAFDFILDKFTGITSRLKKGIGDAPFAQMLSSGVGGLVDSAMNWMRDKLPFAGDNGSSDPGAQGGAVDRWAGVVREALAHVGQPTSEAMVNTVLRRLKQESGGNPRAINNWDINAKRGTPSKGLMQVIGPTFAAFRDKALGNDIWDPLQNLVASMRYALNRYGSLPAAYNRRGGYAEGGEIRKYDTGGIIPPGLTTVLNATGRNEYAFRPDQIQAIAGSGRPGLHVENLYAQDMGDAVRKLRVHEARREALFAGVS